MVKLNVISTKTALQRLDRMMPLLESNIKSALRIEATLEAGNHIVGQMQDRHIPGAGAYNVIKRSLSFDLALHLARLFDARPIRRPNKNGKMVFSGRHPNNRDVASIPLMIRLLRQKRCRNALRERARTWNPNYEPWMNAIFDRDCEKAIDRASAAYTEIFIGPFGKSGMAMLKRVRDHHIAHTLIGEREFDVIYNQLFRLADCARDIIDAASVAVAGSSIDLEARERYWRDEADEFWQLALLRRTNEGEMNDV